MKHLIVALFLFASSFAMADDFSVVREKLQKAMSADIRGEDEKARDRNRNPIETLKFFGLKDNMKVVELIPGGGWYTKLLAPVLADKGELVVAIGATRVKENLLDKPGFDKVKVSGEKSTFNRPEGARFYDLTIGGMDVKRADMVLTFRNYHNFSAQGRKAMNEAAYKALKKGGIYGVVDHTARHMEPENAENRRRIDPVLAIKEILEAGFEFVDYADMHYRPDDELRYEVGRATVKGNTDRFTLMFRKK
ncbi:class I SAM-dependent methyltransferase [Agarilytica rhodophyticola]|uniref:class I SAM-dependent methyltransferase n=1 Tax=Agarilytica rhodophyticola TaxID=1737490 RepID=UPI000B341DE2|nr:class I SAM-dependent methyltransferase [Agarilytica rhodophyticola]